MGSGCGAILVGVTAMSNVGIARGDHFAYWGGGGELLVCF